MSSHTPVEYVAVHEDAQAVTGRADTILMTATSLVACAAVQEYARAATVQEYRHINHFLSTNGEREGAFLTRRMRNLKIFLQKS